VLYQTYPAQGQCFLVKLGEAPVYLDQKKRAEASSCWIVVADQRMAPSCGPFPSTLRRSQPTRADRPGLQLGISLQGGRIVAVRSMQEMGLISRGSRKTAELQFVQRPASTGGDSSRNFFGSSLPAKTFRALAAGELNQKAHRLPGAGEAGGSKMVQERHATRQKLWGRSHLQGWTPFCSTSYWDFDGWCGQALPTLRLSSGGLACFS
jgi:hypothetical protein